MTSDVSDRGVIDSHVHIWDPSRASYPWLTHELAPIDRAIAFGEIRPTLVAGGFTGAVLVQSADDPADTELMLACAAEEPLVRAVIAWAPLEDPDATAATIDRLRRRDVVRGIRVLVHEKPDPGWLLRDEVVASLRLVAGAGYSFDVVTVDPAQLGSALALGERIPELTLVFDHLAHPPLGSDLREWQAMLADAAVRPNSVAKLSGLYAPSDAAESLRTAVETALDVFGADRLMFGGDWPISVLHGGWDAAVGPLAALIDELDAPSRRAIRHETAERVYRLDGSG